MRRTLLATCTVLSICVPCLAGTFAGLEPGVATRADVERVLGPPLEEFQPGGFSHDPTRFNAKTLVVFYLPQSEVVAAIGVELGSAHPRSMYREWFSLGEPAASGPWCDGEMWAELYLPQHIMLCFAGSDATHMVEGFAHIAPAVASSLASHDPVSGGPAPAGVEAYYGLLMSGHQGQGVLVRGVNPGSPAERAGLLPGDVILEFGDATFYRSGVESAELAALMAGQPAGRAVEVLFERGTKRLQCEVVPEAVDRASIDRIAQGIFLASYREGEALWSAGKYEKAIPFLERAIEYNDRDGRGWMLLGFCYLQRGRTAEALDAYARALALMPESPGARFSVAVCHDRLGNREQAAAHYQAYLSAPDQDPQRMKHARKRLKAFSRNDEQQVEWGRLLIDVASAVAGEVGGPSD
jgi:hypothetical protein